jgi:MYXO-CTERM domain-containing protein
MKNGRHVCVLAVVAGLAAGASGELVYGITQEGFLVNWDSATPAMIQMGSPIQGLGSNEKLVGIDFRPKTGELYGIGSFSRMYKINTSNGFATQVGGTFSTVLNGSSFGVDFNPTVDRIRLVSNAGQNLRLHPDTGAVAFTDTNLAYVSGDPNFGKTPNVVHAAYTNNFNGAMTTQLFGIDTGLDALVLQNPPNAGGLVTIGSIGVDVSDIGGFDISGATGTAYLVVRDSQLGKSTFWTINLATGMGSMIGEVGGGSIITAFSVAPAPGALGVLGLGVLTGTRRRR